MNTTPVKEINTSNLNRVYFKQLDGLRCIAVLSVMISHWIGSRYIAAIPLGSMGVNIFFVLSGFLITRILLIAKEENKTGGMLHPIKQFYIRRTLRIFPIYYLTILILLMVNFPDVRDKAVWLFTYTLNIKFALPGVWKSHQLQYFTHLWSLSVEEQFYLFFPFLIFLVPKIKTKQFIFLIIALGIISRLLIYIFNAPANAIYVLTPTCLDAFGVGSLLAYYILYEPDTLRQLLNKNHLFLLSVIIFIGDLIFSHFFLPHYSECRTILERFLFSVCCFWIVGKAAVADFKGLVRQFLESSIAIYIGKISYGLYIYHYFAEPFFNKYYPQLTDGNGIIRVVVYFAATLLLASISWKLIEQPINKLKTKFK